MTRALHGLCTAEAAVRLAADGPNALPRPRRKSAARRFVGELVHFFAIMLWVAALLGFLARLPQLGIAIIIVILVNAVFAFIQESRADRAAERLRTLLPSRVTVVRDGRRMQVESVDIVVGHALVLSAGDRVPADAMVTRATALRLDTSMLTGESALTSRLHWRQPSAHSCFPGGKAPSSAVSFRVKATVAVRVTLSPMSSDVRWPVSLFTRHTRVPRLSAVRDGSSAVGSDQQAATRSGAPQAITTIAKTRLDM